MSRAYTILEILFVLTILSLIVVAIAPYFRTTIDGWEKRDRQLEMQQIGIAALDIMVREIREAKIVTTSQPTQISFKNMDSVNSGFRLSGNLLQKFITIGWTSIAEPIASLLFTYYDVKGYVTTNPSSVHSVDIEISVADSEGKINPLIFHDRVTIRKEELFYAIAINEINYYPKPPLVQRKNEWVEIYNYGDEDIDLTGWRFGDAVDIDNLQGSSTLLLKAGGFAIITAKDTQVYTNYPEIPAGAVRLNVIDNYLGNGLSDDPGETITLYDSNGKIVDSVAYSSSWGGRGDGTTIERKDPRIMPNEAANWEISNLHGGNPGRTPGFANSIN